jgi:hypothetical protein
VGRQKSLWPDQISFSLAQWISKSFLSFFKFRFLDLRLTREEYVNTMRDLIGVDDATDPGGLLEDPEWNGFERLGSVLTLSPTHIEKYIEAAETGSPAVRRRCLICRPAPWCITEKDLALSKASHQASWFR